MRRIQSVFAPLRAIVTILGVVWILGVGAGLYVGRREAAPQVQIGPLVRQIQSLGQLHSVRYSMRDVLTHEDSLTPSGWAKALPGAESLCRAATRNEATVVAEGGVEAGVDLAAVNAEDVTCVATREGKRWRVRLPHAALYAPDVRVQVLRTQPGLFWQDRDIVPKATAEAGRRFSEAALKDDILATAEKNVVETLRRLHALSGSAEVEFYFEPERTAAARG